MFKQNYEKLNNYILPDEKLVNKVKKISSKKEIKIDKIKNIILKPAIAMMILVVSFCSVPVLAAKVPNVYELMYLVSPKVAQFFMPVQKSCEENGIKMEVVSTYIHDNEVKLYITLQDLIGDRIDETTDLNDSYSINKAFKSSTGDCQKIGYDKETKTAIFMITIKDIENKKIEGEKITFTVENFMSHKDSWKDIKLPLSFEEINNNKEIMQVVLTGFSSAEEKYMYQGLNEISNAVIVPESNIDFGVTDMKITGIGYIDNKLHIQVSAKNNLEIDNHGEIYLKNNITNDEKKSNYNLHFVLGQNGDKREYSSEYLKSTNKNRIDYTEYVFDISKDELKDYSIYGDFVASALYLEGKWQVTFPLESNLD